VHTISSFSAFQWQSLSVIGALRNRFLAVLLEKAKVIGSFKGEVSTTPAFMRDVPRPGGLVIDSCLNVSASGRVVTLVAILLMGWRNPGERLHKIYGELRSDIKIIEERGNS
jgi:hypothetical protein